MSQTDRATMPDWLEPMAATLTQERFGPSDVWLFERKFDGIRLLAFKHGDIVHLYSRNRLLQQLPHLAGAVGRLPVHDVILDGEVAWDRQSAYHVFDVLWFDGADVTTQPLEARQALLASLPLAAPLHLVEPMVDADPLERARAEGWEGVIAKRRGSPYEHRRSKHWLKMKCELTRAFVVGGYTDPQGSRVGLGALLVGYYDGTDLVFAGKVGTGLDTQQLRDLRARFDVGSRTTAPFTRAVGLPRARAHWVEPTLVVQVSFLEWTRHGKLRHARLIEILTDVDPQRVARLAP